MVSGRAAESAAGALASAHAPAGMAPADFVKRANTQTQPKRIHRSALGFSRQRIFNPSNVGGRKEKA